MVKSKTCLEKEFYVRSNRIPNFLRNSTDITPVAGQALPLLIVQARSSISDFIPMESEAPLVYYDAEGPLLMNTNLIATLKEFLQVRLDQR